MSWDNTGNADTNPDLDFVGTTDQQPLVFRTNSVEALRVDSDGKVGVGTTNPVSMLEITGDWKDGQQGALRLTGDKPSIKFAGGAIAGNELWVIHLGSRGPGNLSFMKQALGDAPSAFDHVMTLSSKVNPLDSAVEIVGDWKDGQQGALKLTGDKPSIKFAGGGISGNQLWAIHLGSRGPGNLQFMKQTGPGAFDTVLTLNSRVSPTDSAVDIKGDWNGHEGALRLTGDKPTIKFAGGPAVANKTWVLHLGSRGPGNLEFMRQTGPGAFDSVLALTHTANVGIGTSTPTSKLEVIGDVSVAGDIRLANADCAEEFDIAGPHVADPGTVMVLGEEGELRESHQAYDKRVAGVIPVQAVTDPASCWTSTHRRRTGSR